MITRTSCRFLCICFTQHCKFTPDFSNPQLFEIPPNSNQFSTTMEIIPGKITLHNSNLRTNSSHSSDLKERNPILAYFVFLLHSKRQICHLPSVTTKMCMFAPYKTVPKRWNGQNPKGSSHKAVDFTF